MFFQKKRYVFYLIFRTAESFIPNESFPAKKFLPNQKG